MRRKEKLVTVQLTGLTHKGESVGRTEEGVVVFVQGGVPGDKAIVSLARKRKGVWNGFVKEILTESQNRVIPVCQHFNYCGGCSWQNLSYPAQLALKEKVVIDSLTRIAKVSVNSLEPILACNQEYYYRNKLEFTFSNRRWLLPEELQNDVIDVNKNALGFHRPGTFDKIVDISQCHLQIDLSNQIRNSLKNYCLSNNLSFYDVKNHVGFLRNLIIKTNENEQALVLISFSEDNQSEIQSIFSFLKNNFPQICSAYYAINTKKNDSWFDLQCIKVYGEDYLLTNLHHAKYCIGPKSFFQTNRLQAEQLYALVKKYAEFQGHENVYDLYCGVGSIGIYLADQVKNVIGIEEIPEAIDDAKINAKLNNLTNCSFLTGDVKALLNDELKSKFGAPDVVIVDPPRVGIHPDVIAEIINFAPMKIIYVSCNPSTAARDFALFDEAYQIERLRPVDMFPMTNHIELVSILIRR
ncbi:MAG: 23S rRNA (uracil(1939)-C(5))-methyltransferase RlmD [Saprospiraceae bacterium]|nr:23S rRNA (uracil(1939)-C(5))-methyltransferase RlmD [Saprospiraceae bacterium]